MNAGKIPQFGDFLNSLGDKLQNKHYHQDHIFSGGVKLHLNVITVDKKAPTVIFLPGTAVYSLIYIEFMAELANAGFNVVGVDPRGHGMSGGPRGSYTVSEMVDDTRGVITYTIQKLNPEISLIGTSQGGIVSLYTATVDNRVRSLVCHCLADLSDPESVNLCRFPLLGRVAKSTLLPLQRFFPLIPVPFLFYLDLKREPVRFYGNVYNFIKANPLALTYIRLRSLHSLATCPPPAPIENVKTPVLVLHTENDNIFSCGYINKVYNRLTCRKKLKCFPGLPHLLLPEHVGVMFPTVIKWLEEIHYGTGK